ncbi:MAG: restriction endonuclease subunit S [Natrialbaceae archaeon]|nr:restriction endonuclease subunit S [Natrialbaceae archaeon]
MKNGKLEENDVLLVKDGATIGKVVYVEKVPEGRAAVNSHVYVLKPSDQLHGRLVAYQLWSSWVQRQIQLFIRGSAQAGLPQTFADEVLLTLPPIKTQNDIVSFLDKHTARIDALIDKKGQLLKFLENKKKSVVTHAITNGIQNEMPRKQSGFQWLGKIPEHWDVTKLMYLIREDAHLVYGILKPGPHVENGVPYLGAGDVTQRRLSLDELPRTSNEIAEEYERSKMNAGELVYAIRGSIGSVAVIPEELDGVNLSRDAARIAPKESVDNFWLCWALRSESSQRQFEVDEKGATITGVNIRDLKRLILPLPPLEEQKEIATYLSEYDNKYQKQRDVINRGILLLKEKREALITKAVTGQLNLSDWEGQDDQELLA